MFTLIILFLIFRALNPWRWHRPWGGFFWGGPGMWRRPPMHGPDMGGFGPGPGMRGPGGFDGPGGFGGGPGHGAGRF